jgi:DNA repair protein RadC
LKIYSCRLQEVGSIDTDATVEDLDKILHIANNLLISDDREHLIWIGLDAEHKVRDAAICSIGTTNTCNGHPREIMKFSILSNSTAFILVHNHPSGNAELSDGDIMFAKYIYTTSLLMGMPLRRFITYTSLGNEAQEISDETFAVWRKTITEQEEQFWAEQGENSENR